MRIFEGFPPEAVCPICKTNKDRECTLIPIDGTDDGHICQAIPVHVLCLREINLRYNKEVNVLYFPLTIKPKEEIEHGEDE
jgi:hypothetical protein